MTRPPPLRIVDDRKTLADEDIVERLRKTVDMGLPDRDILLEAADEIVQLRRKLTE
jgi:hypothetical protein